MDFADKIRAWGWNLDGIRELAEDFATELRRKNRSKQNIPTPGWCVRGVGRVDGLWSRPVAQMIWVILAV